MRSKLWNFGLAELIAVCQPSRLGLRSPWAG